MLNRITIYKVNVILLFVGYFWINYISYYLPSYSEQIPGLFRLVQISIALIIILFRYPYLIRQLNKSKYLFILFVALYSLRLAYDYRTLSEIENGLEHVFQFVFVSIIPALAVFATKKEDLKDIDILIKYLLFLVIFLSIPILGVYSADEEGRMSVNENLNSQYLGQFAVTLSILSYYHLLRKRGSKVLNILFFIFGIVIMGVSGSRSPLVSLIVTILFFTIIETNNLKSLLIIAVIVLLSFLLYNQFNIILQQFGSTFIDRIAQSIFEGDSSGRDIRIIASFNQFLKSPIIGGAHYIQDSMILGKYPHNLILEAFMSIGIIGGTIFVMLFIQAIKNGYSLFKYDKRNNENTTWVFLLLIQFITFGFFSGSLYSSYYFWGSLVLCLHIANQIKRNQFQ